MGMIAEEVRITILFVENKKPVKDRLVSNFYGQSHSKFNPT